MQVAGSAGGAGSPKRVSLIALHEDHLANLEPRAAGQAAPQSVAGIAHAAASRTGIFSQHASSAHASASCSVAGHHPRAWTGLA